MATPKHSVGGHSATRDADSLLQENEALQRDLENMAERLADSQGREAIAIYER